MPFYLVTELGGTKTHTILADEYGQAVGFGESGSGNPQSVGYDQMYRTLQEALDGTLKSVSLKASDISGVSLGIAGYDWPSVRPPMAAVIEKLGLDAPYSVVNDAIPALVTGADAGWAVVLISGISHRGP